MEATSITRSSSNGFINPMDDHDLDCYCFSEEQGNLFESGSFPSVKMQSLSLVDYALIDSDAYTDYEDLEFAF